MTGREVDEDRVGAAGRNGTAGNHFRGPIAFTACTQYISFALRLAGYIDITQVIIGPNVTRHGRALDYSFTKWPL